MRILDRVRCGATPEPCPKTPGACGRSGPSQRSTINDPAGTEINGNGHIGQPEERLPTPVRLVGERLAEKEVAEGLPALRWAP